MATPVGNLYPFLGGVKKTSARAKCLLIYRPLKNFALGLDTYVFATMCLDNSGI